VLSGSHESMSALENTLMLRVSEFVSAMNEVTVSTGDVTSRMENNIGGFREITGEVLTNLGQLARRFDEHGLELAKAAELIERSNQKTEQSVSERRTQLDALLTTLDHRSGDLEQRLKRFSGLLDESLDAASARARDVARIVSESSAEGLRAIDEQVARARGEAEDVARVLADSTAEGARFAAEQYQRVREEAEQTARRLREASTDGARAASAEFARVRDDAEEVTRALQNSGVEGARALSEQYERLREQAETERRRSAAAMHDVYEQNTADVQSLFQQASERFAETVRGMKQMAAEMQREMEATRAELRRGVLELPQETAESTAQMRRVIVEQIEALAELNRIVARHGRNEAAEPARRSETAAVSLGGGRHEAPTRSELLRTDPPKRSNPRSEPASFAPSTRRAPEPPAAAPVGPPSPNGRGWLSDLLNRASRDEDENDRDFTRDRRDNETSRGGEERSARHTIESLDSLSVDIARMIDHDAAIDLWDRYKRGERNVFTRRLYTLQGQQAFEEIRRKYRSDREFKQTVDRYIGEFERLLDEVSRDDRGQVVARTYLTSETGKVYTMLAHAAGRFE
jgi:hypothetical protein